MRHRIMSAAGLIYPMVFLTTIVTPLAAGIDEQGDAEGGSIAASADVAADVFVEGFWVGQTPVTIDRLPPKEYRVVVKGFASGDFVSDVTVAKGQSVSVAADAAQLTWRSPLRRDDDWRAIPEGEEKPLETAKATKPLREYRRLEIANFLVKSPEPVPPDHLFSIFGSLLESLEHSKKLATLELATNYSRGRSTRWVAADSDRHTMVLSGVITNYDRGSRAKRYWVGLGAGRTRIYGLIRLVDKASGEVLLERLENGSVSIGWYGGSSGGAMSELADDIVRAIEREW